MKPKQTIDRTHLECPYYRKPCVRQWHKCALHIEKDREYPDGTVVAVKACSIWLNADEHENTNNRLAMLQAEMGETKNANIFQALALLSNSPGAEQELKRLISKAFQNRKTLS